MPSHQCLSTTKIQSTNLTSFCSAVIPAVTIPQAVANTYKNLLFSSDQSDLYLVCNDGEILPAHKIIFAAASLYFKIAFDGPWTENNANGEWHIDHPSSIIKAVLTYISRGDVSESLVVGETLLDMLSIAGEY